MISRRSVIGALFCALVGLFCHKDRSLLLISRHDFKQVCHWRSTCRHAHISPPSPLPLFRLLANSGYACSPVFTFSGLHALLASAQETSARTHARVRMRAHTHLHTDTLTPTQQEDMAKIDIAEFNIMCKTLMGPGSRPFLKCVLCVRLCLGFACVFACCAYIARFFEKFLCIYQYVSFARGHVYRKAFT